MLMKLWFSTATDSRFVIVRARPATSPSEGQRDEERGQPQERHEEAVGRSDAEADAEAGCDGEHGAVTLHHIGGHERGEGDDRPEREVDLARAEDEDDGDCHHRHGRRLPDDVEQVRLREEAVVPQRHGEEDEDQQEHDVDDVAPGLDGPQPRHDRRPTQGRGAERLRFPSVFRKGQARYLPRAISTLAGGLRWSDSR
jgi:hypothetical protein